ncbi:response regulator transcription factor [Halpernia frigidisoli]|uniref:Two component transcriptional regulator, LuxR family n=1 Tax=Halpernia frigidisoli TaxID=1125876 RepID=A0A1I3DJZ9_9FLAO|nr:response regulator transcription factor [Halpernia frigidisoli]SFH86909.1 two component transcriptional regulator, LuxR family [Halpernia frigidisoli]
MKIFIVNNHQILIDGLLSLFFRMKNFKVIGSTTTLNKALEQENFFSTDILLVDEYENVENIKQIKKRKKSLKIISLSICNDLKKVKTLFQVGIDGFMEVKGGFPQLLEAMKKVELGEFYMCECLKNKLVDSFTHPNQPVENLKIYEKIETLTKREFEVMESICKGLKSKEISDLLFISTNTVETHRRNIFHKLDVNNSISLVKLALENKLVEY